ncbi:hypothetical protein [Planctomycetes bacterium K23_9]
MIGYRNQVLAAKAWHEQKHCFANRKHQRDFKAGFMQGYMDVADGSNGCVPSVAPSSYWGWRYQSADGQNAVNAWFAGYPQGAQLAEQDGVNSWSNIRPSGANAPQQRQAVFVPPPVPSEGRYEDENPFYGEPKSGNQRYPYEPMRDDAGYSDEEADMTDDDAINSPMDQRVNDEMDLDDTPAQPKDISDAIREALDAPLDDDSASIRSPYPSSPVGRSRVDAPYIEPPYESTSSDQVHVVITADSDSDPTVEVIKPDSPRTANADEELRFTFE